MLKKYFIFILLTAMSVRPAYYVGMVVYYETHVNEIIEKYCENKDKPQLQCNGQCHLAKQLNATVDLDSNSEAPQVDLSYAFYPVYFQELMTSNVTIASFKHTSQNFLYTVTYQFLLGTDVNKPPIVA